jgi:hypothetical protein
MRAELLLFERHQIGGDAFAELRIWRVPRPVRGSSHDYKYSLALIVGQVCVLRYDNEAGKGDHKHIGTVEESYRFIDPTHLMADFWLDVDRWRLK